MSLWVWSVVTDWPVSFECDVLTSKLGSHGQQDILRRFYFLPCDFWLNYNLCNHSWDSPDHLLFPLDNAVFWSFAFTARESIQAAWAKKPVWVTPPWMVISHTHWLSYLEWCHIHTNCTFIFLYFVSVVYIYIACILRHFCVHYLLLWLHCARIKNRMLFFSFPFCILVIKFAFV